MKQILIILLSLFLFSCASDVYRLNRWIGTEEILYGVRLNGYKQVQIINDNSILLADTALTAIALPLETQVIWDFGVDFTNSPILDVYLRTTYVDFLDNSKDYFKIILDSESNEIGIYEGDKLLKKEKYNYGNELKRVKIKNFEKKIKVSIDCDDIFEYNTELTNTEYILFRNNKLDSVKISSVSVIKDDF